MPRAVLLDLFDTIVESDWGAWYADLGRILGVDRRALHQAYSISRVARNTGRYADEEGDIRAVIEAVGIEDPPTELVRTAASAMFEFARGGVRLYDDVTPLLDDLRAAGIRTALVSNCDHAAAHLVDRMDLRDRFDAVILSFEVGAMKPAPAIFRAALDALGGVEPGDAIFVDDQTAFCDGARDLGLDTRLIVRPEAAPPEGVSIETNGHRAISDLATLRPG